MRMRMRMRMRMLLMLLMLRPAVQGCGDGPGFDAPPAPQLARVAAQ